MVYMGSKAKYAKYIVSILQTCIDENNVKNYYELFVGGANVIDKIRCENKYGYDINEYLITLLNYAKNDSELSIAPEDCDFEHYNEVREAYNKKDYSKYSKEYVSLIGYTSSYGGRFYDGGYGRDSKGSRSIYRERFNVLKKQAPLLKNITFACQPYNAINPADYHNCLFYLDPPYRDTKEYAKNVIDYDEFYSFCKELGKDNFVFISEFYMPEEFDCVWQKDHQILLISDRDEGMSKKEKLFVVDGKNKKGIITLFDMEAEDSYYDNLFNV